jgi:fructosamine-3-kinase
LELASRKGVARQLQQQATILLSELGFFFDAYRPIPALLHGDLWSGNYGISDAGLPVIFDPAVYYGDREAEMAMTELFGGFPATFYAAYERSWPLDPGYKQRKQLYNLYHILNHFNLFGGGYEGQALSTLQGLNRLLP